MMHESALRYRDAAVRSIGMDIRLRLRSLVEQVQDDPSLVRREAAVSTDDERPEVRALAHWAVGLAARELNDLDAAQAAIGAALEAAAADEGLSTLLGEILSSHSLVLAMRGELTSALEAIERAEGYLDGAAAARNLMQRGLLLTRMGRLDEASNAYESALPVIRDAGDHTALVRLLLNRSVVHVWQGDIVAARGDLEEALELAQRVGQTLQVAACAQNLGFVLGRSGDVPEALARFAEAESVYRSLGDETGRAAVVLKDRAEVLAEVGLVAAALDDVTEAVEMLARAGNHLDAAEARLTAARLAAIADEPWRSLEDASVAGREFELQQREDWAIQADLVAYAATVDLGQGTPQLGEELATRLDARGWVLEAQEARLTAATVAIRRGDLSSGRRLLEAAGRGTTSAMQRIQAHQARALAHEAGGDTRRALTEVLDGLVELDRHRATLGSIELRARVVARARDLIQLGLRVAISAGDPLGVLSMVESWRAGSMRFPPVRPPDDEVLARDLAQIRIIDAEIHEALAQGQPTGEIFDRRARLEAGIRQRSHASRGIGSSFDIDHVEDLLAEVQDAQVISYFVDEGGSMGAVVARPGSSRMVDIGRAGEIADLVHAHVFVLHRIAGRRGSQASMRAAGEALDDGVERLSRTLLGATDPERPLIVVPTGGLHRLPWQALAPGRPISVAPSLGSWVKAHRSRGPLSADSRALLAAGPDLPGAAREVKELAGLWPQAERLVGSQATVAAVLAAMAGADIAHLAAHGRFRADNPLFSSIRLEDGPLTVYDLERVDRMPPTVVVPSCDIAVSEVGRGDELLGFTAAMLALGVSGMVAPVVPIDDESATGLMVNVHRRLRSGVAVAEALAGAVSTFDDADLTARATASSFVALGA